MRNEVRNTGTWTETFFARRNAIDLLLLAFLVCFTVDSVIAKPIALLLTLVFMWQEVRSFRFFQVPWFYLLIPLMELIRFVCFNHDFTAGHWTSFAIGIAYWVMAWFAFLIIRSRVNTQGADRIKGTLNTWFYLNVVICGFQLIGTMVHSGSLNPYGLSDVQYGNSTGDHIKSLLLAPCYINMFINSFFAIWYLYQGNRRNAILAALVCCLTTTNFANIIFLPVLLVLLFVKRDRQSRITILYSLGLFLFFSILISAGNISYMKESVSNESIQHMSISPTDADTSNKSAHADSARQASKRITIIYGRLARPNGKMLSWKETWSYFISSPQHALFGAGIGNFSSLLAIRTAHIYGKQHSRFYEHVPEYIHPDFYANHYQIMKDVYALPEGYHSARHMSHSFPNNIVGEYGLAGVFFFLLGYVWYFLKRGVGSGYFLVIMFLTGGYLWFDYLFEYLSVMVFFELFFWLHLATKSRPPQDA